MRHLFPGKFMTAGVVALATGTMLLAGSSAVRAQTLLSGTTITPSQTFSTSDLSAFTLLAQQSQNGGAVSPSGVVLAFTARSAVYRENSTGNLAFLYQVTNTSPSTQVGRFTVGQFAPSVTSFVATSNQDVDGGGVFIAGSRAADQADRAANGTPIGFNFLPDNGNSKLLPGQTSQIMAVLTNAKEFQIGDVAVINGATGQVAGYAPKSPQAIPEPGTLALLAPAFLGGIAVVSRRRRK